MSDDDDKEPVVATPITADNERIMIAAKIALVGKGLSNYTVIGVEDDKILVTSPSSDMKWLISYEKVGDEIKLDGPMNWTVKEEEADEHDSSSEDEDKDKPSVSEPELNIDPELAAARKAREELASQPITASDPGGRTMGLIEDLERDGVTLPDEAKTRIRQQEAETRRRDRLAMVDKRVEELQAVFGAAPGALKIYRDAALNDDGGLALVFSETNDKGETTEKRQSVTEVLDAFIDALPTDDKGKFIFSDMVGLSGNDNKPPDEEPKKDNSPKAGRERALERARAMGDKTAIAALEGAATS